MPTPDTERLGATPQVAVRRARFVDVPGVARLLTADHPVVDLDGDGTPDAPVDPEQLSSATRLVLSHGIMEQGEIWVAEDADGLRATTVWLPPEVPAFEDELRGVLVREVGVDPLDEPADDEPVRVATRQALDVAQSVIADALDAVRPRLILVAAAVAPDVQGLARTATLRLLVDAPARTDRTPDGAPVDGPLLTAVVDPARVEGMERIGFVEHRSVDLVPHGRLWIGVRG
ncbi:hypothetical protein [Oerskovia gallyi]|uniref:N-acetyltransferase n=1 Tax=Oerskovia gallyi TaxID=2762226 RepID=A0ABR8V3T2_9CELL|nr:hypothetical protein [Oerskovia gallyi]MBD7999442.1 hypothetical protein [Oerskovia gallyi]